MHKNTQDLFNFPKILLKYFFPSITVLKISIVLVIWNTNMYMKDKTFVNV